MARLGKGLGWKKSPTDTRDFYVKPDKKLFYPSSVDLRKTNFMPRVWDQGALGSCTAFASSGAYSYDLEKQGGMSNYRPSQLFVYYNTRMIEGTIDEDSGAYTRDAIKSLNKYGAPANASWPYNIKLYTEKPPSDVYSEGVSKTALTYARVARNTRALKAVLAKGYPFVVGIEVYESFESDTANSTGMIPVPATSTEEYLGGHCILVVGYKLINGKLHWICRNSWGRYWGDLGYFYLPEIYLTSDLAHDFWVVYSVSSPDPGVVVKPATNGDITPTDNGFFTNVFNAIKELISKLFR